jgi:hypothetical protein
MPSGPDERYDFFLSRRGSVAAVAREVADVLTEKGYRVLVQDYDIRFGDSFIEKMHIGIKNSRDLIILFTSDYEHSAYTRKEFTSFEAQRLRSPEERHIVVLLCEDTLPAGLLADVAYQTLVGVEDPQERTHPGDAAAPQVCDDGPEIFSALLSVRFDCRHCLLVADLLASKGTSAVGIAELHAASFGCSKRRFGALSDQPGLKLRDGGHLR